MGADLGGGLAFADPKHGLAFDLKARGLVAHESAGFREWGASLSGAWDPRPDTDRGLAMSLRQSWGASPAGGMDALLGRETLAGLAANDDGGGDFRAASRLEAEPRLRAAGVRRPLHRHAERGPRALAGVARLAARLAADLGRCGATPASR